MINHPDIWQPKGISDLEPEAWNALRYQENASVIAGPGAGKTEFLAQKATYLLETGLCPAPYRILAISFKKDAAENLEQRVKKRCNAEQARRFESMTFDAFTKALVDRFREGLPENWRPPIKYDITNFNDRDYESFLFGIRNNPKAGEYQKQIAAIQTIDFKNKILATHEISENMGATLHAVLSQRWFLRSLKNAQIDFMLLNRLANFLVKKNIQLHKAITKTYRYVFVDEFQDTTYSQYNFLYTLFHNKPCSITAVGDKKQRIMLWAGAMPNAFDLFISDFQAKEFHLKMNYRSSPSLVKIHHHLAKSLEPSCIQSESGTSQKIDFDYAQIWNFSNPSNENSHIAQWIKMDIKKRKLEPKDYAILVRQKPETAYQYLSNEFTKNDLTLRNEAQKVGKLSLQDIVSDEIFLFISSLFRLCIEERSPKSWIVASDYINLFLGDRTQAGLSLNSEGPLDSLLKKLRPKLTSYENHKEAINNFLATTFQVVDINSFKSVFPYYSSGDNLEIFFEALGEYLLFCAKSQDNWGGFIDFADGVNQIPLLTIHKSKGLEYDTVIFMGLDDNSWWSYTIDNPEGKATFFVALSRAKQRVIFTYSKGDGGRIKINDLYELLKSAGVEEILI